MTASVRIDAPAWGDLRFATLARLCGFADAEHALIKVAKIWSWQTEHYTPDSPTYEVDPELVESALGEGGASHMVRARLAEKGPSGLRIKGSKGRIEWLYARRNASAAGGEATKRKHSNQTGPDGPLPAPVMARPELGPKPGPLTLALPPDQQISDSPAPRAHAIPAPAAEYDPANRNHVDAWVAWTFRAISDARVAVAAEFKISNALPFPMRQNTPSESRGCRDLRARIREEGDNAPRVCTQVVEALAAEGRATKSIDWLSEKAFTEGGWRHAREAVDNPPRERAGPQPRAARGAIGASTPHTNYGNDSKPAREVL